MIQKVELDFPFKQKKPFSAARQLILPGAMSSCTDRHTLAVLCNNEAKRHVD